MTVSVRELTKAVVAERPRRLFQMCPYCGRPCRGASCLYDADLPALERALFTPQSNEAVAPLVRDCATASQPKGV